MKSITFNSAESQIIVTLDDDTEQTYTDAASYLADFPDRVGDVAVFDPHPPVTPEQLRAAMSCSPRQIRQALTAVGLRTSVEAGIAAGDQDIKDWYAFATEFQRMHPAVLMLASALSVPDAQLDSLFELAASL